MNRYFLFFFGHWQTICYSISLILPKDPYERMFHSFFNSEGMKKIYERIV